MGITKDDREPSEKRSKSTGKFSLEVKLFKFTIKHI